MQYFVLFLSPVDRFIYYCDFANYTTVSNDVNKDYPKWSLQLVLT